MIITDAQVHLWRSNPEDHVEEAQHTKAPLQGLPAFTQERLASEMKTAGVDRGVIVTPSWEPDNALGLAAAQADPHRFAVMGKFDINTPGAREAIAQWKQQPGMLGLRFTNRFEGNDKDDWVWATAAAAQIPIMLSPSSVNPPLLARVAERHPQLKLIWDHLGLPRRNKDDAAFVHLDPVLGLARYPNIGLKASGLQHYTDDTYPYRRLQPHLRRVYDAFGPKRMFWGTDITEQACTYRQAVTMYTEEIPWLTEEDKEWIMGRGLCAWLGWALP